MAVLAARMHTIFCVFLRRSVSPDEPSTCGNRLGLSVGVDWSLSPLALCLVLFPRFLLRGCLRGTRRAHVQGRSLSRNWRWTLDSDFRKLQVMGCNLVTYRLVCSFTCSCWRPVVTFWPEPPPKTRLGAAWVIAWGWHHSGNDRDDELSGGVVCRDSRGVNPREHPFERLSWQR